MATTGSNAKRSQNISEAKAAVTRTSAVSIRLVPDLAPANLISELNAGLDYYVANVQSAIIEELEKLVLSLLKVWSANNQHEQRYNPRLLKKLVNSAISPGLSGFERTRDALSSIGEFKSQLIVSSFDYLRKEAAEDFDTAVIVKGGSDAMCKSCDKSTKKSRECIVEVGANSKAIPTGIVWHIECFAAGILRDQAKKFRSAKGALDKQAIAVRGILEANKGSLMLKGKKEGLQDIGTSIKYENWLNNLFENWSKTTNVKEDFRASYQSAFNEYANAIVEYSNTGKFPVQATKDRLIKHLSKSSVESVLERALEKDRELRARGSDSSKPFMHKTMDYLGVSGALNYLGLLDEPQEEATKVITIDAKSYEDDAPEVARAFRAGNPVILNCSEMADEDRKRIVDFASGLIFGNRGHIERVTNFVFLLSPTDVVVQEESNTTNFV
jgi:FtsZ-interacting cell division protein YlmF